GAAAGGEPVIGAAVQRGHATSDGAGTGAAQRAEQGAAGNAGMAPAGHSAGAGAGAGIGAAVQRGHATSDGGGGGLGDGAVPRRMAGTSPAMTDCQGVGQDPNAEPATGHLSYGSP